MASAAESQPPRFSVVVPVYNKRPHLARSISSVLAQGFADFELILVDDGSSDGSLEEMRRFDDARIRVLASETGAPTGPGAARNRGVGAARAAWIAFLDADDEWHPEHLSELERLIEAVPEAGIVGTGWEIRGDARAESRRRQAHGEAASAAELLTLESFLRASITGDPPFWTSAVAVRRDTLAAIGGFPEGDIRRGEDVDTWLRAIAHGGVGARSRRVTAIYHRDSANMVTKSAPFTAICEAETVQQLLQKDEFRKHKKLLKQFSNARVLSARYQYKKNKSSGMKLRFPNVYYNELYFNHLILYIIIKCAPGVILRHLINKRTAKYEKSE